MSHQQPLPTVLTEAGMAALGDRRPAALRQAALRQAANLADQWISQALAKHATVDAAAMARLYRAAADHWGTLPPDVRDAVAALAYLDTPAGAR